MSERLPRLEVYRQLSHFFKAYLALTEQIVTAVERQDVDAILRLVELRQQTIARVDEFQEVYPTELATSFEEERDAAVKQVRQEIRDLIAACQSMDDRLPAQLEIVRDNQRQQANLLAKNQRGLRAYAPVRDRKARYVEDRK